MSNTGYPWQSDYPWQSEGPDFTPSSHQFKSTALGKPFEARFTQYREPRKGAGTVHFQNEHLYLSVKLPRNRVIMAIGLIVMIGLELAILAWMVYQSIVNDIIFIPIPGIGLAGSLPWLFLFIYLRYFFVEHSVQVPYDQVISVELKGRTLSMTVRGSSEPEAFAFWVSTWDGERLYRELHQYFPDSVAQWENLLA